MRVVVLDLAGSPSQPIGASHPVPGTIQELARSGDRLIATGATSGQRGAVWLFDLDDPVEPALVGSLELPATTYHLAVDGDHALVAEDGPRIWSIDLADPGQPRLLAELTLADRIIDLHHGGERAYVLEETQLTEIDLSEPTSPKRLEPLAGFWPAVALAADGDLVVAASQEFLVVFRRQPDGSLRPLAQTAVGDWPEVVIRQSGDPVASLALAGERLFVVLGYTDSRGDDVILPAGEMHELDLSDPASPRHVAGVIFGAPVAPFDLHYEADLVFSQYIAGNLVVYDPARGPTPDALLIPIGDHFPGGFAGHLAATDDRAAYASAGTYRVVDIQPLHQPVLRSTLNLQDRSWKVRAAGSRFLAIQHAFATWGVHVLDAETGQEVDHLKVVAQDIAGRGDLVWLLDNHDSLRSISIDTPGSPRDVGSVEIAETGTDSLRLRGDLALVGHYGGGLTTVDIQNPSLPVVLGRYDPHVTSPHKQSRDLTALDGVAYGLSGGHLLVYDIADPAAPRLHAEIDLASESRALVLDGQTDRLYVATDDGLLEIDIEVPFEPRRLRNLTPGVATYGVDRTAEALVVAGGLSGLLLFGRPHLPTDTVTPVPSPTPTISVEPSITPTPAGGRPLHLPWLSR